MAFKWSIPSLMVARYKAKEYDADAQAFFDAAGITDGTQKTAVNNLVIAFKASGVWDLCIAIWPMVGGSEAAHAVNLKNPGTFDLTFLADGAGAWTHSSNGADPSTFGAYAKTGIIPSTDLLLNDVHLSYYSRTDEIGVGLDWDFGASNGSTQELGMIIRRGGDTYFSIIYTESGSIITGTQSNSAGWFLNTRTTSTAHNFYKNASSFASNTSADVGTRPSVELYMEAINNNGVTAGYSNKECAFASAGSGISGAIATDMYNDIQDYQTALGRQIT